ncbi:MAG: hypothetical protein HQM06_06945 [Magnetococcales bacterium]|nr:hypothetical protein [Magnetococcales bacterium]
MTQYPPFLTPLITQLLTATEIEQRAVAENFNREERVPGTLWSRYLRKQTQPVRSLDEWQDKHEQFLEDALYIDADDQDNTPWTFRDDNGGNALHPQVSPDRYLVRLEYVDFFANRIGVAQEQLLELLQHFLGGDAQQKNTARIKLGQYLRTWNELRDQRPAFATYLDEVEHILREDDWADGLREHLGIAGPPPLRPIPVLLMSYRVKEIAERPPLRVPTVLDNKLTPYFFPTPKPGSRAVCGETITGGHTVSLRAVPSEEEYLYGSELLHPKISYLPEHVARLGWIRRTPALPLAQARQYHLQHVQVLMDRSDF